MAKSTKTGDKKTPGTKKSKKKKPDYTGHTVSHLRQPTDMEASEWQAKLRRQIAEKENFVIKNTGSERVYSDFSVHNAASNNTYKVALRSKDRSLNFCECPDFKTNMLGTCKHIEAVWLYIERRHFPKKLINHISEISYTSMYVSYYQNREIKLRIGTEKADEFRKWSTKYFDADNTLLPASYFHIEKMLQEAQQMDAGFRCYNDAVNLIIERRDRYRREGFIEKLGTDILKNVVSAKLFPYQQDGVLFAAKAGRCILADDMGLGKTVQAIAWVLLMQQEFKAGKAIVICPTSLKYQWKAEIEKFSGASVTIVEGLQHKRKEIYEKDDSEFRVVSYHTAVNDWVYINKMMPDIVILDEAQRIRNWRAKISTSIKRIKSPFCMALTGTPLENNLEELYSLVQYINPYVLGSLHNFLKTHQVTSETGKIIGYNGLHEVAQKLSGIVMRRTKKEVLKQLPARMDKNLFVPMTAEQSEVYAEHRDTAATLASKWQKRGFLTEQERQILLNALNSMRMVCDSTYILDQTTNFQTKLDELFNVLEEIFVIPDEKVVIFSQWERMTRLIANGLTNMKIKFENLHGGIPGKDRSKLFENFNNDPDTRVFLSTDAGSVGLNLQAAAYLINMDIPWNPAILEQRIARIYRMGQKKNVSIINFVSVNTIEHEMLARLKFKSALAEGILDKGEDSIFMADDKFKSFMESVSDLIHPEEPTTKTTAGDTEEKKEACAVSYETKETEAGSDVSVSAEPIAEHDYAREEQAILDLMTEEEPVEPTAEPVQTASLNTHAAGAPQASNAASLLESGANFFSMFVNTLSAPGGIGNLTKSITQKDVQTGKTYLKIPVENAEVVENALNIIAGFLKGMGK